MVKRNFDLTLADEDKPLDLPVIPLEGHIRHAITAAVENVPNVTDIQSASYSFEQVARGELWCTLRKLAVALTCGLLAWLAADTAISLISFWPRT